MSFHNQGSYQRCYHTHPALPLKDGLVIYGGSCSSPAVIDADVYVGFDYTMQRSSLSFPWSGKFSFLFPITDMCAPKSPEEFSQLIDWLILQLTANKKVHLGCLGGHGRTGTVLAALVARFMGRKDAIEYVRANYCKKAVESSEQVAFLMKHFGVDHAAPSKEEIPMPPRDPIKEHRRPSKTQVQSSTMTLPGVASVETARTSAKMRIDSPVGRTINNPKVPSVWGPDVSVFF